MKNLSLLLLLFSSGALFAQNFSFLPASARPAGAHEFAGYLSMQESSKQDSIIQSIIRYKDNGSNYTQKYADSIFDSHSKESNFYTTRIFRDTLNNQFYHILHKRTEAEMEANKQYWKKYFYDDKNNRKKLRGSTLDNLVMTDIQGNHYTSEELRGKVIIIDFWFTTCAPCIQEMPELNKIREEFGIEEVAYFAVTYDEKSKVEKLLKSVKYDFTIVADSKELCDKFGIRFYPTTLVIDKKGKIVYTGEFMGMKEKPKDIRKLLKKLTSGKKAKITAGPIEKQD